MIVNQSHGILKASDPRDVGNAKIDVIKQSQESESIEGISGSEELDDEVFLGYFAVDSDGKKIPIPAPRRLVRMPAVNSDGANVPDEVARNSETGIGQLNEKYGKEIALAEVQGPRI